MYYYYYYYYYYYTCTVFTAGLVLQQLVYKMESVSRRYDLIIRGVGMVQLYMPSVYLYILGPESFYLLLESIHFCGVIRR